MKRRTRAGRLALCLLATGLAAACGGPTEPEAPATPELPDLGVPEFAVVDGLELRAGLRITRQNPSTQIQVVVSTRNQTDQPIEFTAGHPCFVRPLVYARGAEEWIQYPGSPEAVISLFLCPQVVVSVTVPPGETLTLPNHLVFAVADWVGPEFRPGTYVVTATVVAAWGGGGHEVELLAGQVDAK